MAQRTSASRQRGLDPVDPADYTTKRYVDSRTSGSGLETPVAIYTTGDFNTLDFSKPGNYKVQTGSGKVTNGPSTSTLWWNVTVLHTPTAADANSLLMFATTTTTSSIYTRAKYGATWGNWVTLQGALSAMTVSEGTAGTATSTRSMSALNLAQIIRSYITGETGTPASAIGQALAKAATEQSARNVIGAVADSDPRLTDPRSPLAHEHWATDIRDPQAIARDVRAFQHWHDLIAFGFHIPLATQERSRDDGATWTVEDTQSALFDTKEYGSATVLDVPTDVPEHVRWTWNSNNLSYCQARYFYVVPAYTTARRAVITVERRNAADAPWETIATQEFSDTTTAVIVDLGGAWGAYTWCRLTIRTVPNSGTGQVRLASIRLLSDRKGSQGSGYERALPYDWNYDRQFIVESLRVKGSFDGSAPTPGAALVANSSTGVIKYQAVQASNTPGAIVARNDNGNIAISDPTNAVHAATKGYVDTTLGGKVDTTDPRLSDARTPLAHTHKMTDVSGLQDALDALRPSRTVVNVGDFPIVGDGVADDTNAIQTAFDSAPDGSTIFIPPRTYRITGTISNGQKNLAIWMYGATFINTEAGSPFSFSGGFEAIYQVTEISTIVIAETETNNPGTRLILASAPGWRKGDAVKIVSDDLIPGGRPETGSSQRRLGQCMIVQSCIGTEVVLMGELDDPMTTNIRVARFREIGVHVFGGTLDTLDGRVIPPAAVTLAPAAITGDLLVLAEARPDVYTAAPVVFSGTGLPTGITAGTEYYAIPVSDTAMRIASSKANARNGIAVPVSGTPGTVTALFRSWGGSMIAFNMLRNFSMRDTVVENSPNQAFSFNGCYGGKVDNIEVRHCHDNKFTGAFGYGVNMNCSTDVEITNYRAGRVRHAYTDDSAQIAAGATSLQQYGRTKNSGVRGGRASNTSNTAWDTHHHGIYCYFEDVYAEDCNIAVSFRGRKHRARNITVKNVRIAVRAFTETDGGESWGHDFDGITGQALQAFTVDCNREGGPMAGIRENRVTTIKNVNLTGLYRSIGSVFNATALLQNFRIEYGPQVEDNKRLLDFANADVVLEEFEIDMRQNTIGTGIRMIRELTGGYIRVNGLRVRSNSDFTARVNRLFETPNDMVFEATDVVLDYPPTGMVGGVPGSTILEYKVVVGSTDNSEYIHAAGADIAGGLAARELRKTRRSPALVNLVPSAPSTLGAMYDAKARGQIVHLRNSGTADLTVPHSASAKLVMVAGVDKVLTPGQGMSLVYVPGAGWCEIGGTGSLPPHTHPVTDIATTGGTRSATTFLRGDGQWVTPTNTTYSTLTLAAAQAGTETSQRTVNAVVLQQAVRHHVTGDSTKPVTPLAQSLMQAADQPSALQVLGAKAAGWTPGVEDIAGLSDALNGKANRPVGLLGSGIPWSKELVINGGALADGYNDLIGGAITDMPIVLTGMTFRIGDPAKVIGGTGNLQIQWYASPENVLEETLLNTTLIAAGSRSIFVVLETPVNITSNMCLRAKITLGSTTVDSPVHIEWRGRYQ